MSRKVILVVDLRCHQPSYQPVASYIETYMQYAGVVLHGFRNHPDDKSGHPPFDTPWINEHPHLRLAGLVFLAGLGSGVTEAVLVVTPAEVCKIRMQAQFHSLLDPQEMARRKYRNVLQTAAVVAREEGVGALYKGLAPTVLRQGCNQVREM